MVFFRRSMLALALLSLGSACTVNNTPTDLRTIQRSSAPNDALACPPEICQAKPSLESPLFKLDAQQLGEIVRAVISEQERTELVNEDTELKQLVFVQRSQLFGFADTVWVQTVEMKPHASLIVYSRSNVGYWDLGVNSRRVRKWLAAVEAAVEAHPKLP